MSGLSRIVNNTLISLVGQLVTWASTLSLTIAYGRFLGDVKFGELYFAITFVSLVGFPVELGFNQQLTRDVAEDPEKSHVYLWNTLLIKMLLWILLYGVVLVVSWLLGYSQEVRDLVAICGVTLLSGALVNTFASLHYAFERTLFPAAGMMIEKGLSACVGFILLRNGAAVQTMALVLLGGSLLDLAWQSCWFFRLTGLEVAVSKKILRRLIHGSIPFVVYGVLGVLYYRIDTVLLSLMTNSAVVGWYGAGYRLFDTLLFIPNLILNAVMYPVFSKLSASARSSLRVAVEKCMDLLLICSIPIATLMIVAAPNIVGFLYHRAEFNNTIPVIQALAPGLVFLYINTLFGSVIVSTKKERKIPISAAVALVFNLGLNLFLIPIYHQVGAALVTSLTELLLLVLSIFFMPASLLPWRSIIVGSKALLAALVMTLVVFFLKTWSILLILPVAALTYGGVTILLRTVPREDMRRLYVAVRYKSKSASTQIVAISSVDDNVHSRITEKIPVVRSEMQANPGVIQEEDDITERLPLVRARRIIPGVDALQEGEG